ncbi:MAG: hypothetical protein GPJ54_04900 [Candidatus Heimdallarchaeota archaeon]|nr:hypothetical protein [Candidatus Heimdallarchaeota archaeon]
MKKIITAMLLVIFLTSTSMVTGANVKYTNYKLDGTITIDGEIGDWADIDAQTVTLKAARVEADGNTPFTADFYSTHDASSIYFLIVVKADPYYFYNLDTGISHRNAPALGIAFPIDDGALAQYMGGTDRDTTENIELLTGEVDILHWELDTDHGVKTSGTKNTTAGASFGDGVANLDDEYARTAEDRHDDNDQATSENSWAASWSFTGGYAANGTAGDWVFELSRDLVTGDIHDASFAEDETIEVALAYWSPNETSENKWTEDGHYVNYDNVLEMTLDSATGPESDDGFLPGFGLYAGLAGLLIAATILKKRR